MTLLPEPLYALEHEVGVIAELLFEKMISADQMMKLFAALPRTAVLVQIVDKLGDHARECHASVAVLRAQRRQLGIELSGIAG